MNESLSQFICFWFL